MTTKTKVFLMVPNYFAIAPSLGEAYKRIRGLSGRGAVELRKHQFFALEFYHNTQIRVNEVTGSWWASDSPLKLVAHNKLPKDRVEELKSKCTRRRTK